MAGVLDGLGDVDSQSSRAVSPFLAKEAADVSKLKMWRGGDSSGLPVWAHCDDKGAHDREAARQEWTKGDVTTEGLVLLLTLKMQEGAAS